MCNICCFLQQAAKMTEVHKCQQHGCRSNSTDIYSNSTTMVSTLPLSLTDFSHYRKLSLLFKINSVGFCSSRVPVLLVSSCPSHHHHLNISISGPTRVTEHMRQLTTVSEVVVFLFLSLLFQLFFLQSFFLDSLLLFIVIVALLLLCS